MFDCKELLERGGYSFDFKRCSSRSRLFAPGAVATFVFDMSLIASKFQPHRGTLCRPPAPSSR